MTNFVVLTTDQRSEAWYTARLGRLTGSVAADMLATVKKGEAASRRNLRTRLVLERLTGQSMEDRYVSKAMQYGIDREPDAFAAYEVATGLIARRVGFLGHPELQAGVSPDGAVNGFEGVVELKCCLPATHLSYLRSQEIPGEYLSQITHALWLTGAAWADFVSFDDRFPPPLRLLRKRVTRKAVDLTAYELAARLFLTEVERECEEVSRMAESQAVLV